MAESGGGGGYSGALALSVTDTSANSLNSPFYVTGGGGSSSGLAPVNASGPIKPATLAVYFLVAASALIGLWLFFRR